MGWDEVQGIIRAVVPALVGVLAGAGVIGNVDTAALTTAVVTIGACVWSVIHKKQLKS